MTTEQWVTIELFPAYQVSDLGRVRRANKVLTPSPVGKGYLQIGLMKDGKRHRKYIHVLVGRAFILNPLNLPQVNHKQGEQKWNNAVSNLEWRSDAGNKQHAVQNNLTHGDGVFFDDEHRGLEFSCV